MDLAVWPRMFHCWMCYTEVTNHVCTTSRVLNKLVVLQRGINSVSLTQCNRAQGRGKTGERNEEGKEMEEAKVALRHVGEYFRRLAARD